MKHCPKCDSDKDNSQFYFNKKKQKLSSYCKECHVKYDTDWQAKNRQKKLEINRDWRVRNKPRRRLMEKASNAVFRAIKQGKLIRPTTCSKCGGTHMIQAAHSDYDESKLLEVVWLCIKCHRAWDMASPKTLQTGH